MTARGLGWCPDGKDDRDYIFGAGAGAGSLPYSGSMEHLLPEVLDQGALESCVAHGAAEAIFASHYADGYRPTLCSRLWLFNLTRSMEHRLDANVGVSMRDTFTVLNKLGFCPEEKMPYDADTLGPSPAYKRVPSMEAFRAAFDQRYQFGTSNPARYERLIGDGEDMFHEIKAAITARRAVVFGIEVYKDFVDNAFDPLEPLKPNGSPMGGHCMVVCGYIGNNFVVRNSWGKGFGHGGNCILSGEYMLQSRDRWVVRHALNYREG